MNKFNYTYEEAKVWITKVKGKKLRWSRGSEWSSNQYFIPNGKIEIDDIREDYIMFKGEYHYNSIYFENTHWFVSNGYELDRTGDKWSVFYDWETELESLK